MTALWNPFMPYRHLNPRASGLIVFKGGSTTNVTNTGLGDDQYKALADNQVGISNQITTASSDAMDQFNSLGGRFDTLGTNLSGLSTTMLDQFKAANTNVNNLGTAMGGRFDNLDTMATQNRDAIGGVQQATDQVGRDVVGGFAQAEQRFNTIDQANTDLQNTVDTGFVDQAQAFSDLNANVGDAATGLQNSMDTNFQATGAALQQAQTDIRADVANTQANVLGGQGDLANTLSDLGATQDIYFGATADAQDNLQAGQNEFRSSFDNYLQRYDTDTTLANQTRADIQTAQANAADRIREDLGNYAQATAQGQAGLTSQLNDVANATGQELLALGTTVEGGFASTAMEAQQAQQNLTTRLGNVKNLLQQTGDTLDAQTKAQYESLSNSFDAQGNLIANSIDGQGNTIKRSMDQQGNLIETKFSATGQQIGQTATNVNQLLSNAEQYQQQTMQGQQQLAQGIDGRLTNLGSAIDDTGMRLTQTMTQNQQGLMGQMDQNQAAAMGQYDQLSQKLAGGFQNLNQADITQTRDLARIAATQSDLDMGLRQNFQQLGSAFDDTGNLIRNSIDAQGNTISRAVDANGNLLLKSFDATGREIGNKVININRSLSDLGNLNFVPGANISMGNLSPASQGSVPTSGFMSPFATTR